MVTLDDGNSPSKDFFLNILRHVLELQQIYLDYGTFCKLKLLTRFVQDGIPSLFSRGPKRDPQHLDENF